MDDQTSASIVEWQLPARIGTDAKAVYPGRASQRPTAAERATGTGGPTPQWRPSGMVGVAGRTTSAGSSTTDLFAMFRIDSGLKIFLHRDAVDGRKNINGLALLVEQGLGLDPFAQAAYVFSNRRRDRIKILLWDRNGFWLLIKRLEADRFQWPKESDLVELSVEQLHWLLDGINLSAMRPHPARHYLRVGGTNFGRLSHIVICRM